MKNHERKIARVVVVNPDGTIILNKRPDWSKQAPGKLQIMGGKFERIDETRKHSAQREVKEELGLSTSIGEFLFFNTSENNGWITFAFILLLSENYDPSEMPNHGEFDSICAVNPTSLIALIEEGQIAFDHPEILKEFLEIFIN